MSHAGVCDIQGSHRYGAPFNWSMALKEDDRIPPLFALSRQMTLLRIHQDLLPLARVQ